MRFPSFLFRPLGTRHDTDRRVASWQYPCPWRDGQSLVATECPVRDGPNRLAGRSGSQFRLQAGLRTGPRRPWLAPAIGIAGVSKGLGPLPPPGSQPRAPLANIVVSICVTTTCSVLSGIRVKYSAIFGVNNWGTALWRQRGPWAGQQKKPRKSSAGLLQLTGGFGRLTVENWPRGVSACGIEGPVEKTSAWPSRDADSIDNVLLTLRVSFGCTPHAPRELRSHAEREEYDEHGTGLAVSR